jgi:hypothetical protein
VIDITLWSFGHLKSIIGSEVSSEPSLSDHRHILFTLHGYVQVRSRGSNWDSFNGDLNDRLDEYEKMAGLWLAIYWLQQALIIAYKDNCRHRTVKRGRQSLVWTSELAFLTRGVR